MGTTFASWQLFFQQSNVVDKRLTTRFLGYERADTVVGTAWRTLGLVVLRCYLFAAIAVPAARAVQIALGSG